MARSKLMNTCSAWILAALVLAVAEPGFAAPDRATLVRYCEALFLNPVHAAAARRYFDGRTRRQLVAELTPVRKFYHRGTLPYSSVAYVMAWYDIDVEQNTKRMLYAWFMPSTTTSADLDREGLADEGHIDEALTRLYRRYPTGAILRPALSDQGDASAGETQEGWLADAFVRAPERVLRAAMSVHRGQGIAVLGDAIASGGGDWRAEEAGKAKWGDYSRERRAIRRLERSRDPAVAQAAHRLRIVFEREVQP